jgi:tripartite-type tricarboxylate transporter receptor subunit TctC
MEAARNAPDTLTYSTPGNGTTNHLAMEWLSKREGIKMRAVPFQGNPQSISAVLGGHISAVNASTAAAVSSHKAGLLKPLVVLSEKRIDLVPDTMTLREKGYDFYQYSNLGAVFPPKTPEEYRKKMEDAIRYAVEKKNVQEKVANELFISIDFKSGTEYKAKISEYREIWGRVLDDVGLKMKK